MLKKKVRRKLPPPPPDDEPGKPFDINKANKFELDKEHVRKRIRSTEVRTMNYEMDLGRIREELIEKRLVEKQLAFLLIAMRQKVLALPNSYARKILHLETMQDAMKILQEMSHRILNEIADLPRKVVDPNWLETLEEEND
jgi:hypothetical protein